MQIFYGIISNAIDVTEICKTQLIDNNIMTIPSGDSNRAHYFSDPIVGTVKSVFILLNNEFTEYDHTQTIRLVIDDIITKLYKYHSNLKLNYGSFSHEFPEQKMSVRYLTGNEKVLEIGGNIGRNSLIISSILGNENQLNFVCLESDREISYQLSENRDINGFRFHIENSALSKRQLIQKDWNTIVSDTVLDGYTRVNTITLDELNAKYNVVFDTLVLDCEGAFYYILMDMPEILDNIRLIIMENDYIEIYQKIYVDEVLSRNNFYVDYTESLEFEERCCKNNFFEVWKRKDVVHLHL